MVFVLWVVRFCLLPLAVFWVKVVMVGVRPALESPRWEPGDRQLLIPGLAPGVSLSVRSRIVSGSLRGCVLPVRSLPLAASMCRCLLAAFWVKVVMVGVRPTLGSPRWEPGDRQLLLSSR